MLAFLATFSFIFLIPGVTSFLCSNSGCGSVVNCTNLTAADCTVTCNTNGGCNNMAIHCPVSQSRSCYINCVVENACYDIEVISHGSNVYVTTSGAGYPHQIENSVINCNNNANCILDCNLGAGSACNMTDLYCNNVGNCLYDCSGNRVCFV